MKRSAFITSLATVPFLFGACHEITNSGSDFIIDESGIYIERSPSSFEEERAIVFGVSGSPQGVLYATASPGEINLLGVGANDAAVKSETGDVIIDAITAGDIILRANSGGIYISLSSLPTSNPGNAGQLYRSGTDLGISTG